MSQSRIFSGKSELGIEPIGFERAVFVEYLPLNASH